MPLKVSSFLDQLDLDADDAEALSALRQSVEEDSHSADERRELRDLLRYAKTRHEGRGEHRIQAELLELEAGLVHEDRGQALPLLREFASLLREELLGDARAKEVLRAIVDLDAKDKASLEQLQQLEEGEGRWREIADRFIDEAGYASDASLRTSLLTRAAGLVWQHGGDGKEAEADRLFREALEADPTATKTARIFSETLRQRGRFDELAEVLRDVAGHARSRDEKLQLFLRAGKVFQLRLDRKEDACVCFERVLDFVPGHPEALRYLVDHFTEQESWEHLVALYEDALRARQKLESEQGILLQLAMVHWRIRKDPKKAEPYFARLRKIEPAHPGMLEFYRSELKEEDPQRLTTILADALRVTKSPEQRLSLAVDIGRSSAGLDDAVERAIDAWKSALRIASDLGKSAETEEARHALRSLYRKAKKWNALVELLKEELQRLDASAVDEKLEHLRELVAVYRDELSLDAMVINTYTEILALAPEDRVALRALSETYESVGRWNDLISVYMKMAALEEEAPKRVELYLRVARLWIDRFANYNQATKPLEEVIALEPENEEALSQLRAIYEKKRSWEPLYDVIKRQVALSDDGKGGFDDLVQMARIAGDRLQRPSDAIELWQGALEQRPGTKEALSALEKLADRERRFDVLATVLEERVSATENRRSQIKGLQKLGAVYQEQLSLPAEAASAWKRVLELDPKNGRAMRTLREAYLDAEDWDSLEALYRELGDFQGLVEVLGTAADRTDDPEVKVRLSFRAAEIYEQDIGDPHRAFRSYERVLSVRDTDERAAAALVPIYERDENWARLAEVKTVLYNHLPSDAATEDRLARLEELRRLTLHRLRDEDQSLKWATRAYELAPERKEATLALEETALAAGAEALLYETYSKRISGGERDSAHGAEALSLRRRLADLAAGPLKKADEAIEHLQTILEMEPADADATEQLKELFEQSTRRTDLRDLVRHEVDHAESDDAKLRSLRELAALEHELGRLAAAAECHEQLLTLGAEPGPELATLERLYRALLEPGSSDAIGKGDEEEAAGQDDADDGVSDLETVPGDVAAAEQRAAETTVPDPREVASKLKDVLFRRRDEESSVQARGLITEQIARLYEGPLADPPGAFDAYAELLLEQPGHSVAVEGLERLGEGNAALAGEIGPLLERAYEHAGADDKLVELLAARLEEAESPDEQRTLALRLAGLYGSLGSLVSAYKALEGVLPGCPTDTELWDRLSDAADASGCHEDLAAAYGGLLEGDALNESEKADLATRIGTLYDRVLQRPDEAEPFHKQVLAADPLAQRPFEALKELYTTHERWEELQQLYRNRIAETVDADAKLELLLQVCFLFEELLDDPENAIRTYQQLLDLEPNHSSARRALERLFRRTERFRDLVALLRQDLDGVEGQDHLDLMFELGSLHEKRLGEPAEAVDYYESVLRENPQHLRAQEALERLLETPSQRQRIAGILEPLYQEQGAYRELARIVRVQLEDVTSPGLRIELLGRLADLHEQKLRDAAGSFDAWAEAVSVDATDSWSRQQLARVSGEIEDGPGRRAEVLESAISVVNETAVRCELLTELAELWMLADPEGEKAESVYRRLIAADSDNPDTVLPAARALERIHTAREDYAALTEDLQKQISFEHDVEIQGELLLRLAEVRDRQLGDIEGAIAAHRKRLDLDSSNMDAHLRLEALFERQSDWQRLIGILRSREQATFDETEQRSIGMRVAAVYRDKLNDQDDAIVALNDVLSRFGPDPELLDSLITIYRNTERWPDLLETIELALEESTDPAEQLALRFEAAELMRLRTDALPRAVQSYADVLNEDRRHGQAIAALDAVMTGNAGEERLSAARVLLPIYEESAQFESLLNALRVLADSEDHVERVGSLRRAAEVAENRLNDIPKAFDLIGRTLRIAAQEADADEVLAEFERLAEQAENWKPYIDTLREVEPDLFDAELQKATQLRIAGTAEHFLEDRDTAITYYQKVLESEPEDRSVLDALERLHLAGGDHPKLYQILLRKTEIAEDAETRKALLIRRADLAENELGDDVAAIEAYESVLAEAEALVAYEGLERLYNKGAQHAELAGLLERELDQGVGNRVDVHYRLGQVFQVHLGDVVRAIDEYRAALSEKREHEPTIEALSALMKEEEHKAQAAEILEPVFLRRMDWPRVTHALEARINAEEDLDERKQLLSRLATIHEDYLEDLSGAMDVYARLFREDTADEEVWDTLERLARNQDAYDRLGAIYDEALTDNTVDDGVTIRLCGVTGRLFDDKVQDNEKAAAYYRRVLAFDSAEDDVFARLEALLARTGKFQAQFDLYREHVELRDDDEARMELLHRAAGVKEKSLDDKDGAIDVYREIVDFSPNDERAILALDRLLEESERWEQLVDHIQFQVEQNGGTTQEVELRYRAGQVLWKRLEEIERAVDAFEEVVRIDSEHPPTIEALESLVQVQEHQRRIVEILEPIYRASNEWKKLIAILEAQCAGSAEQDEKVRLLGEIATLHEEQGENGNHAFEAWARAFAEEPGNEEVRNQVDRLATSLEEWDAHVAAYEKAFENADDAALKSGFLLTMASVHDERRGDPRAAIDTYERLAAHDPDDPAALDALDALHTLIGDWRGLVDVLKRRTGLSYDPAERAELWRRAGAVLDELLSDRTAAVESYRKAAEEDPDDDVAYEALDRLYEQAGNSEELAKVLARRMENHESDEVRVQLGLRLAVLQETQLANLEQAIDAYQRVTDLEPGHPQAVVALAGLYERKAQWPELLDNLKGRAADTAAPDERADLLYRAAAVLEREMDDVPEALQLLEEALENAPAHEESIATLLRIAQQRDHRVPVAEILESRLEVLQRFDDLAALLSQKVEVLDDPFEKSGELRRLALLHEQGRQDLPAAFGALSKALEHDDGNTEILDELERLAASVGCYEELAATLQERAAACSDSTYARELYLRTAKVADERLNDDGRAIAAYRRALAAGGDDDALFAALDRLYQKTEEHSALGEVLERRVDLADDEDVRITLLGRLGALREQHQGDIRGAFEAYRRVLEVQSSEEVALEAMERFTKEPSLARDAIEILEVAYQELGRPDRLGALYDTRIELADSPDEKFQLLAEAAAHQETQLGAADVAIRYLREAVLLDPFEESSVDDLERLAEASGNWAALKDLVERLPADLDPPILRDYQLRAARWYRDKLNDWPAAEERLASALDVDPESLEAHQQRIQILRAGGREAELADALFRCSEVAGDPELQGEQLREAAKLAEHRLGDIDKSVQYLEAILATSPRDTRALDDLIRIGLTTGRHKEVAGYLEIRIEDEENPETRLGLRRRHAALLLNELSDQQRAVDAYRGVLDEAPGDQDALSVLEQHYEATEQWTELEELIERRLDAAQTQDEQIAARIGLARLQDSRFGRRAEAVDQLREILAMEPAHAGALAELERLLTAEENWDELLEVFEGRLDLLRDPGERLDLLLRMAAVHQKLEGDEDRAVATYERILEVDPDHHEALRRLADMQESAGRGEEAATLLERLVSLSTGVAAVEDLCRLATLRSDNLGDAAGAEAALKQAYGLLQGETSDVDVLGRLKAHYEAQGEWDKLASLLCDEAGRLEDAKQQVPLYQEAARLFAEELGDQERAAESLRLAVELAPQDRSVLVPLSEYYLEAGKPQEAVQVLERVIASFGGRRAKELAIYHHQWGRALEEMGDQEGALKQYGNAFQINLTSVPILRDLGRLAYETGDLERAQKSFRALLLQKLDAESGFSKADVYFHLASIAEKKGDAKTARAMAQRAIAEDADHGKTKQLLGQLQA